MDLNALRGLAGARGVAAEGVDRVELVRSIQRHEGNFDCFGTAWDGYCDQQACLWREDCRCLSDWGVGRAKARPARQGVRTGGRR